MSESSPDAQDLVLGGQLPPPLGGLVLGGLAGLEQRFSQADVKQKLAALSEAEKFGKEALPLLHRGLKDANLDVRMAAFSRLKLIDADAPQLERGLPLNVGDRIYAVYESSVFYNDDLYYISGYDVIDNEYYQEEYSCYHSGTDSQGSAFEYLSDAPEDNQLDPYDEGYSPTLIAYYLDATTAAAKAKTTYEEKFGNLYCELYEIERSNESEQDNASEAFDLKAWVEANQIVVNAKLPSGWGDDDWAYESRVLVSLQNQKQFSLLCELWQQRGYTPLAFVHEYVIDRPSYLRITSLES